MMPEKNSVRVIKEDALCIAFECTFLESRINAILLARYKKVSSNTARICMMGKEAMIRFIRIEYSSIS